ncbi:MAG: hypothetical protein ABI794_14610 [Betaproteobacteria bacterium]
MQHVQPSGDLFVYRPALRPQMGAGDSRGRGGYACSDERGAHDASGGGLQHECDSSHLLYATVPNCVAYGPCFGYEVTLIVQDGARRMLELPDEQRRALHSSIRVVNRAESLDHALGADSENYDIDGRHSGHSSLQFADGHVRSQDSRLG